MKPQGRVLGRQANPRLCGRAGLREALGEVHVQNERAEEAEPLEHGQPLVRKVVIVQRQLLQIVESFERDRRDWLGQIVVRLPLHGGQSQRLHLFTAVDGEQQFARVFRQTFHAAQVQLTQSELALGEERFDELQEVAVLQQQNGRILGTQDQPLHTVVGL